MPEPGPQIIRIDDAGDPRLADYANVKDRHLAAMSRMAADGRGDGLFMAEGELVVRQLLASGLAVKSVLLTETRLETMRDAVAGIDSRVPVYLVDQEVMSGAVGFHIHRGVLAAGWRPEARTVESVLEKAGVLVVLEDLANHDNVGGIFRTAAALGGVGKAGAGILLSPRCCDPLYRKAIRVSMGMVLRVPFAVVEPWPAGLARASAAGFKVVALTPDFEAEDIATVEVGGKVALLLGTEGRGLSSGAAKLGIRVRIPMAEGVDSLNVVVAAGIALHKLG